MLRTGHLFVAAAGAHSEWCLALGDQVPLRIFGLQAANKLSEP